MSESNETKVDIPKKEFARFEDGLIWVISLSAVIFHLCTAGFGILPQIRQTGIHWAMIGSLLILARQKKFKFNQYKYGVIIRYLLVALMVFIALYSIYFRERLIVRPASYDNIDVAISVVAIVVALWLGFKFLGATLPIICIVFILYTLFGRYIPGLMNVPRISFTRIATSLYTGADAMFGRTLMVPARFMLLYVFFGRFMEMSGTGQFLVDVVSVFTGRVRGGAAQAAVYSSMLMGTVSGSGHANVATTGVFTIPLMKQVGYKAKTAGAVEAVASTGGMIMPPVMGSVAFMMAEITGISYSNIALSAAIPAILYYICLSSSVYSQARLLNIPRMDPSEMPSLKETFKKGWFHLLPIGTIFYLVFGGTSPQRAVFWALICAITVTLVFNRKALSLPKILEMAKGTAITIGPLALTCMLAGIIMCTVNLSGFGLNITRIIQVIAGGNLMFTLILAMLLCLLLGMGMPASACYILLSALIVPAIIQLNVSVMAAHLFIIYFGALSSITPPVALSSMTAANISGAGLWETGGEAVKLASAGFVVPFIFVYYNELLLMGDMRNIIIAIVTALLGSIALGQATSGWCAVKLPLLSQVILIGASIMLFMADNIISLVGLALYIIVVLMSRVWVNKRGRSTPAASGGTA